MKRLFFIFIILNLIIISGYSQINWGFFDGKEQVMMSGPEPEAMGNAYTAICYDGYAVFFNPAISALSKKSTFVFVAPFGAYVPRIMRNLITGGIVPGPNKKSGYAAGFEWKNFKISDDVKTNDFNFYYSYSRAFFKMLSIGITAKGFFTAFKGLTSTPKVGGFGEDIGIHLRPKFATKMFVLSFAFVVKNVFSLRWWKFGKEDLNPEIEVLPRHWIIGAGLHVKKFLRIGLDFKMSENGQFKNFTAENLGIGAEYWFFGDFLRVPSFLKKKGFDNIALRLGINLDFYQLVNKFNFTFGLGIKVLGWILNVSYGVGSPLLMKFRLSLSYTLSNTL